MDVPPSEGRRRRPKRVQTTKGPHEKDRPREAIFLPASGRGGCALCQGDKSPHLPEATAQFDVLHERDLRVPPHPFEDFAFHEDALVPRGEAGSARANIDKLFGETEPHSRRIKTQVESPPDDVRCSACVLHHRQRVSREPGIGVEEKQNVPFCITCPTVHLAGATGFASYQLQFRTSSSHKPPNDIRRPVGSPSINDDNLLSAPERAYVLQAIPNSTRFVEDRNDDADHR